MNYGTNDRKAEVERAGRQPGASRVEQSPRPVADTEISPEGRQRGRGESGESGRSGRLDDLQCRYR
ncbi:hypothetical protein [Methylorubrum sp. SB2]|uniref:hypothetical protein n=1 Tax=Methylorubrum subtropicum TaxID=3138812 RepID=UPI00313BD55C